MLLTNPIWLWALAGLTIPVAIHLLSRKEGQVIRIGSLRHLQETNTQQFKGIRLNEIVLLALRCMLIVLFVLMMGGLSFQHDRTAETKWLLVEKGLHNLPEVKTQLDTFQNNGYEVRWLSKGFPLFADSASITSNNLYWTLVEELRSEPADDITIISKSRINNFKGKRPEALTNIRWISVPEASSQFTLNGKAHGDSIFVRKGRSDSERTDFTTEVVSKLNLNESVQPAKFDSITVVIASDKSHQFDKKIVEASLQALRSFYPVHMKVSSESPEKVSLTGYGTWCFWLTDQAVSDSVDANIIYLKPEANQQMMIQERSNRWIITKELNEEVALNESFTVRLASLLLSSEKDWERAFANDRRVLPDESAWSKREDGTQEKASMVVEPAGSYLLIVFLLTFLIERVLAYYRNQ